MPNRHKPIEECDVWDVLDWDVVAGLSAEATGDPRDNGAKNLWPWLAKDLIDADARPGDSAAQALHRIASPVLGYGPDAVRRQKAAIIAEKFGADPIRLIEYLSLKWGLFKRS